MIFDWVSIFYTMLYERPEQLPAIFENDIEHMDKKGVQFETAFFKWLQELYSEFNLIEVCAIIQALILNNDFTDFRYTILWLMEQPEKEGGLECTDIEYALYEFYGNMIGEDEFKEAVTDPVNCPTPITFARLGSEYRFNTYFMNAYQELKANFEEDEH